MMNEGESPQKTAGLATTIAAATLTVVFTIALATNVAPWLRGPKDWRWAYAIPGTFGRLWLPATLLALYVAAAGWLHGRPTNWATLRVVMICCGSRMNPPLAPPSRWG